MRGLAVVALLMFGACTLMTTFDPEGQPCDLSAQPGSQCLNDYHCDKGKCVKGAGTGGGSGGSSGGTAGSSGGTGGSGGGTGGGSAGGSGDAGRPDGGRTDGGDGG